MAATSTVGVSRRLVCRLLISFSLTAARAAPTGTEAGPVVCNGTWTPIKAADYAKALNPGWNLGNTLDALPDEGSWNNPPVVASTFDQIKAAGFKSVRIPVTYNDHYIGGSPDWTINQTWLQRVSDVIDMATSRGLYVLTNQHHDSWNWADVTKAGANLTMIEEKTYASWLQIGRKLACKSELVSFEPINEPPSNTAADAAEINKINQIFLNAIAEAGGRNKDRFVTLVGPTMDSAKTSQYFVAPKNITNPWALQFHYYSPYDFIMSAWGKTIWGSADDKNALTTDMKLIRGNFTNVPLIIGEWSATTISCEASARQRYTDYFIRAANAINATTMLWDNGVDQLDRTTGKWRDPALLSILMNAVNGTPNALPDGTTDTSAETQSSSAYIFHRVGDAVQDTTLQFQLNGNTLKSIYVNGGRAALVSGTDYTSTASGAITFKASFLSTYLSPTAAPGSKTNLTLTFSAGAQLEVEIVQWDTPTLATTSSTAVAGSDLHIPITWKGLNKLAAVRMQAIDGTFIEDDWTKYLGPLQQARATYNNQWNWDDTGVIVTKAAIADIIAHGVTTAILFEFYPRVHVNAHNYSLEVSK